MKKTRGIRIFFALVLASIFFITEGCSQKPEGATAQKSRPSQRSQNPANPVVIPNKNEFSIPGSPSPQPSPQEGEGENRKPNAFGYKSQRTQSSDREEKTMTFQLTSSAFQANQPIPKKYTGEGEDISPALTWENAPAGTQELALICDDPDAPLAEPWVHWIIYQIPADRTGLPENVSKEKKPAEVKGALQGINDFRTMGYGGPLPPPGHGVHHYHFKLYALDIKLSAQPGWTKKKLLAALRGHILSETELVGTYERK